MDGTISNVFTYYQNWSFSGGCLQKGGGLLLTLDYQVSDVAAKRILGHIQVETKKVYY
jgi:hypothetical protein